MKQSVVFLLMVMSLIVDVNAAATRIYQLDLDDEIGSTTWRYTRRALDEATEGNADMIFVHLNTYGGSVVHADSIRTALLNYPKPVVAWVDNNAASAGALIALACDTVYMRPGSSMGAATVVNGSDGTAMPDKYQSYMRAMMRATAEHHGRRNDGRWRRSPLVAEAMVDTRVVVPGLIDSTKVLTFTPDEAIRWGFAEGKAESVGQVMEAVGVKEYTIERFEPTWLDNLVGFLTSPGVQAVLIMLIVGGIYMEFHTPGLGFPAAAAIIAAILYFLPLLLTGIVAPWLALVFVGGVILLVLEVFVIPGFGVAGIAGIVACSCALLWGLVGAIEFHSEEIETGDTLPAIGEALLFFTGALVAAALLILYLSSSRGPKWFRRRSTLDKSQLVADGYIGVDMSPNRFVGSHAVTATDLRPVGKINIDGDVYDAVSDDGNFIAVNTRVKITRYRGAQLYVRKSESKY